MKKRLKKAVSVMSKQIFKQNKNKKISGIDIIKEKDLLKVMLDKIFQPAIAGNFFSDLITTQRKEAYKLIDNLETEYNSKLVSVTKYGSYTIALLIIISGASFVWKLNKYKDIIINKIDKKYKNIIIKILLRSLTNSLFQSGIKFITLFLLSFTIDIPALKSKKLKINPIIELLTKVILEKIFIRFNSTETYNDFEEKEENPKKETLALEGQKA